MYFVHNREGIVGTEEVVDSFSVEYCYLGCVYLNEMAVKKLVSKWI